MAQPLVALQGGAGAFGHALVVLAGQQPARQRAPDGGAQPDFLVQMGVFDLHALAVEHVVLRLFHLRGDQVFAAGDGVRLHDLRRAPFAGAPVKRLALVDDVVERPHGLLDGGVQVRAVGEHQVHIIGLQAFQGGIHAFDDMFARETAVIGAGTAPKNLGREHQVGAFPAGALDDLPHHNFGLPAGIRLGVVKEVDSGVVGGFHQFVGGIVIHLGAKRDPRPVRERGNLQTG